MNSMLVLSTVVYVKRCAIYPGISSPWLVVALTDRSLPYLPHVSMELSSYVCAVLLVYLCQLQGSSAVTPVFVQKGNDVLLNVKKADVLQDIFTVVWNFNKTDVLVIFSPGGKPTVPPAYTERVEFSVNDYSLKVKNLQEADSGVYTAQVIGDKQELTEYNVTVQDAVSPVELKVDSVSNSSDSCNLTVTCSTQDSHINSTFTCDTKTCSQEGGEQSEVTTSGASLHVYLVNHSIICNHSNHVNWTKDIKMTEHFCPQHAVAEQSRNNIIVIVPVIVFVAIVIFIIVAVFYRQKRRKCPGTKENTENTIYSVPEMKDVAQPPNPTNDASDPSTVYSLVGTHTGSTETRVNPPESLYAQIEKPATS